MSPSGPDADRWLVEYQASIGTWHTDTSGSRIFYDSRDAALEWAARLRLIQEHVRLRHEVISYETITTTARTMTRGDSGEVRRGVPAGSGTAGLEVAQE